MRFKILFERVRGIDGKEYVQGDIAPAESLGDIEYLVRVGAVEPDEPSDPDGGGQEDLTRMPIAALKALAKERGVAIPEGAKKADIVAVLNEALNEAPEGGGQEDE